MAGRPARHLASRRRAPATAALALLPLALGVALLVVPLATRWVAEQSDERTVSAVEATADGLDARTRELLIVNAHAYNDALAGVDIASDSLAGGIRRDEVAPYERQLGEADAAIAWMEAPSIDLALPVYRGTDEDSLAAGVGHLEGTSLPVGGPSTHCVLSAHSGMASRRMFDGIRALAAGDLVVVHVLGEELAYEVVGSEVVLPEEVGSIGIELGSDLLTLVTCTPYGVNDHRLLVHARRCDGIREEAPASEACDGRGWPILVLLALLECFRQGGALRWPLMSRLCVASIPPRFQRSPKS